MTWEQRLTILLAVDAAATLVAYVFWPAFRAWLDEMIDDIRNRW